MFNKELAEQRGLSPSVQRVIRNLQDNRGSIKSAMESALRNTDVNEKRNLLNAFRENEKQLQKAWEFDDNSYLRFMEELKLPGCTCPYLDNKDARGIRRYVHKDCPWHN